MTINGIKAFSAPVTDDVKNYLRNTLLDSWTSDLTYTQHQDLFNQVERSVKTFVESANNFTIVGDRSFYVVGLPEVVEWLYALAMDHKIETVSNQAYFCALLAGYASEDGVPMHDTDMLEQLAEYVIQETMPDDWDFPTLDSLLALRPLPEIAFKGLIHLTKEI